MILKMLFLKQTLLFKNVQGIKGSRRKKIREYSLSDVRKRVQACKQLCTLLLEGLCKESPFFKNEWEGKPKICRRTPLHGEILKNEGRCATQGQLPMPYLRKNAVSTKRLVIVIVFVLSVLPALLPQGRFIIDSS